VNCLLCGCFVGKQDALPVGGGVGHFHCIAKAQATGKRSGKVLVMVVRKGPAFERRA
jgi:hypothetical protein